MSAPTILLSAGEPSGDLHGAAVARAILRRWPSARLFGLGGSRMAEEGVELLADVRELAVMGFAEVLGRVPYFVRLLRRLREEMAARGAELVLPIDYPGFNLRLTGAARASGIPVLYYIAPQVWAWHRSRIRRLAREADRLAVVLPFEEPLFREAGARVRFVGHPLLDDAPEVAGRESFCAEHGLDPARPILALFPGSRAQEVSRHLAIFVEAAEWIRRRRPEVQPVIATSAAVGAEAYAGAALPRTGESRALLAHARAALVKSGTTTLEAALAATPMVIAYRTSRLTYALARRLVRVDHIGLVNLVAGARLVPEFVQDAAEPAALAGAVLPLLDEDAPERRAMVDGLNRVRAALAPTDGRPPGAAERVAVLAGELLGARA
ncbi:MAG TPA: lipid-A-disaccharide synthase [Longimicrobiales bacterium]